MVLVAVEDERVDHPHLVGTCVEIQSDDEGQPLTTIFAAMGTFDADTSPDLSTVFHTDSFDFALVVAVRDIRIILRGKRGDGGADQPQGFAHRLSIDTKTVNQRIA